MAEGPELTELLLDMRGTPGLVSVHPGQVQDRYIEELKHTAVQEAIWVLHQTVRRLRSVLLEFYPQALQAFPNLKHVAPSVRTNSRDGGNFRRCGIGGVVHCSGLQQSPLTRTLHLAGNHTALTGATYDIDGCCDD